MKKILLFCLLLVSASLSAFDEESLHKNEYMVFYESESGSQYIFSNYSTGSDLTCWYTTEDDEIGYHVEKIGSYMIVGEYIIFRWSMVMLCYGTEIIAKSTINPPAQKSLVNDFGTFNGKQFVIIDDVRYQEK